MVLGLHGMVGGGAPLPFWCLAERCQDAKVQNNEYR